MPTIDATNTLRDASISRTRQDGFRGRPRGTNGESRRPEAGSAGNTNFSQMARGRRRPPRLDVQSQRLVDPLPLSVNGQSPKASPRRFAGVFGFVRRPGDSSAVATYVVASVRSSPTTAATSPDCRRRSAGQDDRVVAEHRPISGALDFVGLDREQDEVDGATRDVSSPRPFR